MFNIQIQRTAVLSTFLFFSNFLSAEYYTSKRLRVYNKANLDTEGYFFPMQSCITFLVWGNSSGPTNVDGTCSGYGAWDGGKINARRKSFPKDNLENKEMTLELAERCFDLEKRHATPSG